MNCPTSSLQWFANGTLPDEERMTVAAHLAECAACRDELAAWTELRRAMREVSAATPAPRSDLFAQIEREIDVIPEPVRRAWLDRWRYALNVAGDHIAAQARLIRRDLFVMPLLLVPLVGWVVYTSGDGTPGPDVAALFATLLAALGMAFLYGQEVDPARELVLATPTSPRLVLGLRCGLVFGYYLLINCGLVLPLLAGTGIISPEWFLTNWLAPLCCLSALALLLAVVGNSTLAVAVCASLWGLRLLARMDLLREIPWPRSYEGFWHQAPLLFALAAGAALLTFGLLEKKERFA